MLFHKFVIIGAGKTGLDAAYRLGTSGQDVLLIESNDIGGSYIFSYDYPKQIFTQEVNCGSKNLKQINKVVKEKIGNLYKKTKTDLQNQKNTQLLIGHATFSSKNLLNVKTNSGENLTIAFEYCIIATGQSQMHIPPIKGLKDIDFLHQHNVFFESSLPKKLAILNVNEENLQIAELMTSLGSHVTFFDERAPEAILEKYDTTLINYTLQNLLRRGVEFYFQIDINDISYIENTDNEVSQNNSQLIQINDKEGNKYVFNNLYLSVIEKFADNLNLEHINIKFSDKGVYSTATGQSTQKNIWVFGAASNTFKTINVSEQLHNFVEKFSVNKNNNDNKSRSLVLMNNNLSTGDEVNPIAIEAYKLNLSNPIATVGLAYKNAVGKIGSMAKFEIMTSNDYSGFIKIIYHEQSKQILGISLGGQASDILYATAIEMLNRGVSLRDWYNIVVYLGFKR
jgi:pyruvate/2-oxoglutarate dehydrogenase complex dihydrolipoamide dehydrogenase (E3) component